VTTMDAAAARRLHPGLALAVLIGLTGVGLAGCESSASLFGGAFGGNSVATESTPPPKPVVQQQPVAKIALAPIIGAPDAVAKQIQQEFTGAVEKQRIAVSASKDERVDYTLRGYIVAAKDKNATKLSYIWDVTDPTGKRVNRITGEEVVAGTGSKDPWAALTPAVAQSLATKAANSFVAWLPSQSGQTPVASAAPPAGVGAQATAPTSEAQAKPRKQATAPVPTATDATPTGSIGRSFTAVVPRVTGAPGDGTQSLTSAIQQELAGKGVTLADAGGGGAAYRIEGKVTVGAAKDGKQPIHIEWLVRDPQGKKLGTVSQRNEIPEGSLDGAWGSTAQQAAGAAVQGIVKLLPMKTAAN
jgi:hypothetical protein